MEALSRWPSRGIPERPGAWLLTTARRKAIDRLRRDARYEEKLAQIARLPRSAEREPDERLRLIFTCCHPALNRDAQIALTLRAVVGLTTEEIGRAFLVSEATLSKRLTRAKQKIAMAGIPYRTPGREELSERLVPVLQVIYLLFNEGYLATGGGQPVRRAMADDAEWLAEMLVRWLPNEPEPLGLLALIRFHLARWTTRLNSQGHLVLLADQDRELWDRARIRTATSLLRRAAAMNRLGPFQVEAAIAAVHAEAPNWEATDWPQLLELYTMLQAFDGSPIVRLNRAVVVAEVAGPAVGLAEVDSLADALDRYYLFHATRAALLRRLGMETAADEADERALASTSNAAERTLIQGRLVRKRRP